MLIGVETPRRLTTNIGYLAAKLGYEPRGPQDFPVFALREGPPPKYEVVEHDQVLDMLRQAVRAVGKSRYALSSGGISADTSRPPAAVSGKAEIPARFLEPLGIDRRANGTFVREVRL